MIKYTPQFLKKIEDIFEENSYRIRYEKGNFKSGYCLIEDRRMVIVNKFASTESRINTLIEILKNISAVIPFTGEKFEQVKKMLLKQQQEEDTASESGSDAANVEELSE